MGFETLEKKEETASLPEENELPLNIKESEKLVEGGESTIWKTLARSKDGTDKLIALKQAHKEVFANEEEMRESQKFYEFLKNYPEFGKFVPDTLYFKARETSASNPQAFCLQKFIEGERIDRMKDDEIYNDPAVIHQLLELSDAAIKILRTTRENKIHKPDFMWTPEAGKWRAMLGAWLSDPRYSSNILVANKPNEAGQRVFFVDTGVNATERTKKIMELHGRHVVSPLGEIQFKRWRKRMENILEQKFHETPGRETVEEESAFSKQWNQPERLRFDDSEVEVFDIKPEHKKTDVPTVFMPGWGNPTEMYKKDLEVLSSSGRRAIAVNAPHGIDAKIDPEVAKKFPEAELRKIMAVIGTLDQKKIEKIDAIGDSEGAIDAVIAATLYPERFRNIVLVNPAGMIGKDNIWRLAYGFLKDISKSHFAEAREKGTKESLKKLKAGASGPSSQSPIQSISEVRAIAQTQIDSLLKGLKDKGIGISIIHGVHDEVFPMERVQQMTKANMIDGFYSVRKSHSHFELKEERYKKLAEEALTALEKKQEKRLFEQGSK